MRRWPILQIRVTGGEASVHAPGTRDARPSPVEVTDETGRPVEGARSASTCRTRPQRSFVTGCARKFAVTDERGRAVVRAIEFNRVPGGSKFAFVA